MYGFPSRDLLSKRQSRWVREVDEIVRSNPAQKALVNDYSSKNNQSSSSIISILPNSADSDEILVEPHHISSSSEPRNYSKSLSQKENPLLRKNNSYTRSARDPSDNAKDSNNESKDTICNKFNSHIMNIIPDDSNSAVETLSELYTDLKRNYDSLSSNYNNLKQQSELNSDLSERIDNLEKSHKSHKNNNITDLSNRIRQLEHSKELISSFDAKIYDLTSRINHLESILSKNNSSTDSTNHKKENITENSSDFSLITESEKCDLIPLRKNSTNTERNLNFLPFFIKEEYAGRDNKTSLNNFHLELTVEILGLYSGTPIIYPFGLQKLSRKFSELTVDLSFRDADNETGGTAYAQFKLNDDGVYIMEITELYSDGEASGLDKYTLPLTMNCTCDLIPE